MQNAITAAIKQICDEKEISQESVVEALESALAAAYRKDFGNKLQNIKVKFNLETGESEVFDIKTVVEDVSAEELEKQAEAIEENGKKESSNSETNKEGEEEKKRFNPKNEIMISEAKKIDKKYELGDQVITELIVPSDYGRVAAQTAKQVIIQKLREAERSAVFDDYKNKEGKILVGTVQRREDKRVLIDLGRITAIMPLDQTVERERYRTGDKIKVYVVSVQIGTKGPEIIVSRSHENMIKEIFATEIPEIASGAIEIVAISREAGSRSKVAVRTNQENIDPIGSCIGQRGSRIQTIISELGGEKVDIILYDEDILKYIANALSPAKILSIEISEDNKQATVKVASDQFSLAIGKTGQNVRLASKLTGYKIDIVVDENSVSDITDEVAVEPEPENLVDSLENQPIND